jgi:hypothetical protein
MEESCLDESFTGDFSLGTSTFRESSSGDGGRDDSAEDKGEGVGVGGS